MNKLTNYAHGFRAGAAEVKNVLASSSARRNPSGTLGFSTTLNDNSGGSNGVMDVAPSSTTATDLYVGGTWAAVLTTTTESVVDWSKA